MNVQTGFSTGVEGGQLTLHQVEQNVRVCRQELFCSAASSLQFTEGDIPSTESESDTGGVL